MTQTRRHFLTTAAAAGSITLLAPPLRAAGLGGDRFTTPAGEIAVHPIRHASIVMETPVGNIFVDPVGEPELYSGAPKPDLILITHEHGDHFNIDTLTALAGDDTPMVANPGVYDKLTPELQARTTAIANGEMAEALGVTIDAIPAYNLTEDRLNFHPQGRDNGYVISFDGFRVYISGDTEDVPEMRALENIDLAFVCMNLPFTMDSTAAASAVAEFAPTYVYPYHYRGRDGGTQDPAEFAALVGAASDVKLGGWYG